MRDVQMQRTQTIDGFPVIYRRRLGGWVTVLGEGYVVHITRTGSTWVARRPLAQEPIATAPTMYGVFRLVKAHYDALIKEQRARIRQRLQEALAEYA